MKIIAKVVSDTLPQVFTDKNGKEIKHRKIQVREAGQSNLIEIKLGSDLTELKLDSDYEFDCQATDFRLIRNSKIRKI